MSIQSIGGISNFTSATAVGSATSGQNSPSSIPPPAIGAAATASVSGPGQLFSQLQELSKQDPSKFKAVTAQLATAFQTAASQASGPQAKLLTNLANQFSQAAQTGQLQPPQAGGAPAASQGGASGQAGGAQHHHHGGGGFGGSAIQQAFQNAASILEQALQGTSSTSASSASSST